MCDGHCYTVYKGNLVCVVHAMNDQCWQAAELSDRQSSKGLELAEDRKALPLNAIRAFVMIARESSVTRAAQALGITQSSASRHLAVLESYLGAKLVERRGRHIALTDFGKLFVEAVEEPLDAIAFAVQRMRRNKAEGNRIVVRTSLPTFAYSTLIPNLSGFAEEEGGAVVDVVTSMAAPSTTDALDVLITRDLETAEPSDQWDLMAEQLVCVGAAARFAGAELSVVRDAALLSITSRPDILSSWLDAMSIAGADINFGARYDHHYLALPAVTTGQGLLVAPEIVIADLVRQGILTILPGSRVPSGMHYWAYALDRGRDPDLSRAFCRWLVRLCKRLSLAESAPSRS